MSAPVPARDLQLMRVALELAEAAGAAGDIPIGAVVADADGTVIATGANERERLADPTAHAEVVALRRAAAARGEWNLEGWHLVVTCEPCTMCAGAIGLARIAKVTFGCWEPKTGAVGSLWDVLRDRRLTHRVDVRSGVLADEAGALMRDFFAQRR